MARKDYIPSNDLELINWGDNAYLYSQGNCERWGVPVPTGAALLQFSNFKSAVVRCSLPTRSKVDTVVKNELKAAVVKDLRTYVQGYVARNPLVTTQDREMMNLPLRDTTPTAVSIPLGQADAEIDYIGRLQLRLRMNHIDNTPIDPKANYGFRIYFGVYAPADTPPATGKELRESRFTRRKTEIFIFQPEDAGKTVYFCIRYENSKGEA